MTARTPNDDYFSDYFGEDDKVIPSKKPFSPARAETDFEEGELATLLAQIYSSDNSSPNGNSALPVSTSSELPEVDDSYPEKLDPLTFAGNEKPSKHEMLNAWSEEYPEDEEEDDEGLTGGFSWDDSDETTDPTDETDIEEFDELAFGANALIPLKKESGAGEPIIPENPAQSKKKAKSEKPLRKRIPSIKIPNNLGEKFAQFKAQAAAELKGKDAPPPSKSPISGKELALLSDIEKENDETGKEKKQEKAKNKKQGKPLFTRLTAPFVNLYLSLVNFIFKLLEGVLGFLGKIPLIGWPFRMLKELTKPLKIIATSLPLLLIIGGLIFLNVKAVPALSVTSLPDEGSATFTSFSYNSVKNTATGKVINTGDVIAEIVPTFTVYSMKPSLNPLSWVMPSKLFECKGDPVKIDIDQEKTVTGECKELPSGLFVRVSGELK